MAYLVKFSMCVVELIGRTSNLSF